MSNDTRTPLGNRKPDPATAPEHAELLYVRNKIALTAAEQLARKQSPQ